MLDPIDISLFDHADRIMSIDFFLPCRHLITCRHLQSRMMRISTRKWFQAEIKLLKKCAYACVLCIHRT